MGGSQPDIDQCHQKPNMLQLMFPRLRLYSESRPCGVSRRHHHTKQIHKRRDNHMPYHCCWLQCQQFQWWFHSGGKTFFKNGQGMNESTMWSVAVVSRCPCMLILNDVVRMPHSSTYHQFTTREVHFTIMRTILSLTQYIVFRLRGAWLPAVCVYTMFQKFRPCSLSPSGVELPLFTVDIPC